MKPRPSTFARWMGGFLFLLLVPGLQGATMTLQPSRDNTLYFDPAGSLSNGRGPAFFAGKNGGSSTRRALIAFDLAAIPPGSIVTGVSLQLSLVQAQSFPAEVALHRVTSDWGEGLSDAGGRGGGGAAAATGDATWLHTFNATDFWTTPGGDFIFSASATTIVGAEGANYFWNSTSALVADIQSWVDDPATNHGWIIRGDESQPSTAKAFASLQATNPATRPALTITFAAVPEPASTGLLLASLVAGLAIVQRKRRTATTR